MNIDNKTVQLIIVIVLALLIFKKMSVEGFQLFEPRTDLRDEPTRTHDIYNHYIWPESHWRLNQSSGVMYQSKHAPYRSEGNCKEVDCPPIFDGQIDRNCPVNPDRSSGKCWNCA